MLFYKTPTDPDEIHDYARTKLRRNMRVALTGEFSYTRGRLPRVWEDLRRDVEELALFNYFEERELVRVEESPDDLDTDDIFGDCFDESHADTLPGGMRALKAQEREAYSRLGTEGVWVVQSEYQHTEDGWLAWIVADSIGGFVGDDFNGSGYEPQVCMAAVNGLAESRGFDFPEWFPSKDGAWLRQCQRVWEMYEAMHAEAV